MTGVRFACAVRDVRRNTDGDGHGRRPHACQSASAGDPAVVGRRQPLPYDSHFVELDGNTEHYVDEGDGPTLLMLHGNPTWSFLYRDMIAALRSQFRYVALDYRASACRAPQQATVSPRPSTPTWSKPSSRTWI